MKPQTRRSPRLGPTRCVSTGDCDRPCHPSARWRVRICVLGLALAWAMGHFGPSRCMATEPVPPSSDSSTNSAPQILPGPSASTLPYLPGTTAEGGESEPLSQSSTLPVSPTPQAFSPEEPCKATGAFGDCCPPIWGVLSLRGFPYGQHIASNGVEFKPLFAADISFNFWIWRRQGLYLYIDAAFWGQKAAPGITNPTQGQFDFSKREYDLAGGAAWNYWGPLEARVFAYSFNNLNRGDSSVSPSGFKDGVGVENRIYVNSVYKNLGNVDYDLPRANFLGIGYFPTKDMIDAGGNVFKPGLSLRGYMTFLTIKRHDRPIFYVYSDTQFLTARSMSPALFILDAGLALRPFDCIPRFEFRVGTQDYFNLHDNEKVTSAYLGISFIF